MYRRSVAILAQGLHSRFGLLSSRQRCPVERRSRGDFWRDNESRMPNVARIARWLLSCAPSTAATERLFSSAGRVFTKARSRLGERGQKLLECHWNRACGFKGDP